VRREGWERREGRGKWEREDKGGNEGREMGGEREGGIEMGEGRKRGRGELSEEGGKGWEREGRKGRLKRRELS